MLGDFPGVLLPIHLLSRENQLLHVGTLVQEPPLSSQTRGHTLELISYPQASLPFPSQARNWVLSGQCKKAWILPWEGLCSGVRRRRGRGQL